MKVELIVEGPGEGVYHEGIERWFKQHVTSWNREISENVVDREMEPFTKVSYLFDSDNMDIGTKFITLLRKLHNSNPYVELSMRLF